jgi:hypothetical protein
MVDIRHITIHYEKGWRMVEQRYADELRTWLARLNPEQKGKAIESLQPDEALVLAYD